MSRKTLSKGFTWSELLSLLAILAVLAAIFFPVFQRTHPLPNGVVRNSLGKPIPGAVLRFRDPSGHITTTITADNNGEFRLSTLREQSRNTVDGFGLTAAAHRTGSPDLYTYTPFGTQIAIFRDHSGKPLSGVSVEAMPDHHTWQWPFTEPIFRVTDSKGVVSLSNLPLGGQLEFLCQDPRCITVRTQANIQLNKVSYVVTAITPATIQGRLLTAQGQPLRGYKVFATVSPDLNHFERRYSDSLVTGPTGQFHITGLTPKTYYVSAAQSHGFHAAFPAQRVTVADGQTVKINLHTTL